jgi:hypothetical protein
MSAYSNCQFIYMTYIHEIHATAQNMQTQSKLVQTYRPPLYKQLVELSLACELRQSLQQWWQQPESLYHTGGLFHQVIPQQKHSLTYSMYCCVCNALPTLMSCPSDNVSSFILYGRPLSVLLDV